MIPSPNFHFAPQIHGLASSIHRGNRVCSQVEDFYHWRTSISIRNYVKVVDREQKANYEGELQDSPNNSQEDNVV